MSWVAEILRKQHRICAVCGLGPTHVYLPAGTSLPQGVGREEAGTAALAGGTPLCTACLADRLARDLPAFPGRCLLFEPAFGPEALLSFDLEGETAKSWDAGLVEAAGDALGRIGPRCDACPAGPARFAWVPVEPEACLWEDEWLPALSQGLLRPGDSLCGRCAAARLIRSMEERGLFFEAIAVPARPPAQTGAGSTRAVMFGAEVWGNLE